MSVLSDHINDPICLENDQRCGATCTVSDQRSNTKLMKTEVNVPIRNKIHNNQRILPSPYSFSMTAVYLFKMNVIIYRSAGNSVEYSYRSELFSHWSTAHARRKFFIYVLFFLSVNRNNTKTNEILEK